MNSLLAYLGDTGSMSISSAIDSFAPIIISAVIVMFLLAAVIGYLLANWQPKSFTEGKKATKSTKKKSTKKK